MTTRILTLVGGFVACSLLACGDFAIAQPPPPPGTVTWGQGYPQSYNSVGPPMPQKGGVKVYGTYTAPQPGWAIGNAGFFYVPKVGGVMTGVTIDQQNGAFGLYDINTKSIVVNSIPMSNGDYNVWVNVIYTRYDPQTGKTDIVPVSSAIYGVTVK